MEKSLKCRLRAQHSTPFISIHRLRLGEVLTKDDWFYLEPWPSTTNNISRYEFSRMFPTISNKSKSCIWRQNLQSICFQHWMSKTSSDGDTMSVRSLWIQASWWKHVRLHQRLHGLYEKYCSVNGRLSLESLSYKSVFVVRGWKVPTKGDWSCSRHYTLLFTALP
jgi:hypothetical protein